MMPTVIHEKCSGCGTCKLACAMENFNAVQPARALLRIEGRFPMPGDYRIHFCDQCGECADNCPVEAIAGERREAHLIDQKTCTKCGICIEKCPFNAIMKV